MKVLRLESPLYFGNAERFRNALIATAGMDPSTQQQPRRKEVKPDSNASDDQVELLDNDIGADENCNGNVPNGVSNINKSQGLYHRPTGNCVLTFLFSVIHYNQEMIRSYPLAKTEWLESYKLPFSSP